jgi:drug/metabolite transporter (DMT)-like permease
LTEPLSRPAAPSPFKLYGLIACMALFWSLNFIVGKIALREFPSLLAATLRATIAGFVIVPLYLILCRGKPQRFEPSELRRLLLLGVVGIGANQVFFVMGLGHTSVGHASILIAFSPIMVLLLATLHGQERLDARKMAGMAVAAAGAILLQSEAGQGREASILGDVLILLASLTFSYYTVIGKNVTARHDTLTMNTIAYAGSAVALAPLTLWQSAGFDYGAVSMAGWLSLLYMALFPSLIAYMIFYYALTWIPASRLAAFAYLQPFLTMTMAVALLGDPISKSLATGGAMVLAGVWLVERPARSGIVPEAGGSVGRVAVVPERE